MPSTTTRIRIARNHLGLSQTECACLASLYVQQLSRIELGEKCGPRLRGRIALALDLPETELFDVRKPHGSAYPLFEDAFSTWSPAREVAAQ